LLIARLRGVNLFFMCRLRTSSNWRGPDFYISFGLALSTEPDYDGDKEND